MYSTCLFCNHHLGANAVIERLPIGRRVAFDSAKGRLWVVCRHCERWNLTPFDERWEAVEDCERRFRDARTRASSENVGLARVDDGLELVRIGAPLRPEFAAWRYGDQFGRRRRRSVAAGAGVAALGGAVAVAGIAAGALAAAVWGASAVAHHAIAARRRTQPIARVPRWSGETLTVRGAHAAALRLRPDLESGDGWALELPHDDGVTAVTGWEAVNAIALVMPRVNRRGAPLRNVRRAVQRIEAFDDPLRYLLAAAHVADAQAPRHKAFPGLPLETRLAIEMVANEENERIAIEGDLALLELDWKEAEEVAVEADQLLIPAGVQAHYERLRGGAGRGG